MHIFVNFFFTNISFFKDSSHVVPPSLVFYSSRSDRSESAGRNFALDQVVSRLTKSLAIYYGWHSDETLYVIPVMLFYFAKLRATGSWKRATVYSRVSRGYLGAVWELTRSTDPLCSRRPRTRWVSIENSRDPAPARAWRNKRTGGLRACDYSKRRPSGPASVVRNRFEETRRRRMRRFNSIKILYRAFVKFMPATNKEFYNIGYRDVFQMKYTVVTILPQNDGSQKSRINTFISNVTHLEQRILLILCYTEREWGIERER